MIGCGAVTERKSAPAFNLVPESRLVAVASRTPARAESYAKRHGVPRWHATGEALLADPEVDVVYIATPPGSHLEWARKVADAGKSCYVEKPLARNAAETAELSQLFRSHDLPLFPAYYRRALPRFVRIRDSLKNGELGDITRVNYRYASKAQLVIPASAMPWRVRAAESGGGLFVDIGCHVVDLLDFLLCPLECVCRKASRSKDAPYRVEDRVLLTARIRHADVSASFDFVSGRSADRMEIVGTRGRVVFPVFAGPPVEWTVGPRQSLDEEPDPEHVQQPLIASLVNEMRGVGVCEATPEAALRAAYVLDAALDSFYGGRQNGFWLRFA